MRCRPKSQSPQVSPELQSSEVAAPDASVADLARSLKSLLVDTLELQSQVEDLSRDMKLVASTIAKTLNLLVKSSSGGISWDTPQEVVVEPAVLSGNLGSGHS